MKMTFEASKRLKERRQHILGLKQPYNDVFSKQPLVPEKNTQVITREFLASLFEDNDKDK